MLQYPTILTNKDWQKKKGLIGKATKTGVGEALDALQKVYLQSGFAKHDPQVLGASTLDPVAINQGLTAFRSTASKSVAQIKQCAATADSKINKAIVAFASGSSQNVRKHLQQMQKDLKQFVADAQAYPAAFEAATTHAFKQKIQASSLWIAFVQAGPNTLRNIQSYGHDLQDCDSPADVHDKFKDGSSPGRCLTTACKTWDQLVITGAPSIAKKYYPKKAMESIFKLPWIQDLGNENMSTASGKITQLALRSNQAAAMKKFKFEATKSWSEARDSFLAGYAAAIKEMQKLVNAM